MNTIKWIAGNGKEVTVSHKTEEQVYGEEFTTKCDEMVVTLGCDTLTMQGLENGMIITRVVNVRIPAEYQAQIVDLYKGITDRRSSRRNSAVKADAEYRAGYDKISRAMAE